MADDLVQAVPDNVKSFDNTLNGDFHASEYDTRLDLARTVVGGAVASVVDAGASIWNSLPGTPEVDTADVLTRLSNNAVQVYNENPDTIHTLSFIGGSLVPFGLATKGMTAARAGVKGVNWFSKAGKEAELAGLNKIFGEAGAMSAEYKTGLRSFYGKGFANQALDAVAGEVAVMGLMHAHPLMEDYYQDPVKNFAIGIGLGSVIGGTIGHIADRYALRSLTGATSKQAIDATIGTLRDIAPDMTAAVALQSHEINIKNLGNILADGKVAGKTAENDLAMSIASRTLLSEQERQASLFEAILSPEVKALPKAEKDVFMREIIDRPEMFGVDKVGFLKPIDLEAGGLKTTEGPFVGGKVQSQLDAAKLHLENNTGNLGALTNKFLTADKDAAHFSYEIKNVMNMLSKPAGDISPGQLEKALELAKAFKQDEVGKLLYSKAVEVEAAFTGGSGSIPSMLKDYSQWEIKGTKTPGNLGVGTSNLQGKPSLTKLNAKDEVVGQAAVFYKEFGKFGGVNDAFNYANAAALGKTVKELEKSLPSNYGRFPNLDSSLELLSKGSAEAHGEYIAARARVETWDADQLAKAVLGENDLSLMSAIVMKMKGDVSLARNVSINLSDRSPMFKAILDETAAKGLNAAGVPQKYADAVAEFTKPGIKGIDQFDPKQFGNITEGAKSALSEWVSGGQALLNKMALTWSAKGFSEVGGLANLAMKKNFESIYNSPESQALRAKFMALADADGNVPLYRGSYASKLVQQNILESFTTDPAKAAEFGTVRLMKVHVDNIVAGWGDIASHDGLRKNEIIVLPTARPEEAVLSPSGVAQFKKNQLAANTSQHPVNGKKMQYGDLAELLVNEKQRVIDEMLFQGIPMEAISLKADVPYGIVESYATAKNGGSVSLAEMISDVSDVIKTKTVKDAEDAISRTNAPIKLEGNTNKNPYIEGHANLNNKDMKDMNDLITMTSMYSSNSPATQELARYFYEELKIPMDILKQQLGAVNNEFAGSKFLNSTDFWARNMGSVGPVATAIGRQVQRITNDAIKRIVTPVSEAMSLVTKDSAAVVEFNTFFNINSSLKGWRAFTEDGTLVQKVLRPDAATGKMTEVLEPVTYNGEVYKVTTDGVKKAILSMQQQGGELLSMTNTAKKIKGQADVNDIGLWIPSFNPVNKFIAYVHDQVNDTTKMIWANTKEQFNDQVVNYKKYLEESGQGQNIRVVTKDEQADWNVLNGRLDVVNMERADVGMQKTGAASAAIVRSDASIFSEIAGGYEHYITAQMRNLAELNMHEVTGMLDRMSVINQAVTNNQPLSGIMKVVQAPKDAAATLKNTLLGSSNLGEYAGWKSINQSFETGLSFALNTVGGAWNTLIKPLVKNPFGKDKELTPQLMKKMDYEKMTEMLEQRGIVNPWATFDKEAANMFGLSKIEDSKDTSKRLIYASNALAATVALRIGELAQPIVNILSLPILTGLAVNSKMPAEFLGSKLGTANLGTFGGVQIMYEGARAANSPLWKRFDKIWEKQGHYTPLVSEASNVLRMSRSFEKGAISSIENALDSNMVQIMSKPADWSESFVRRQTMFTGAVLAKRLYPELSDEGITIFARDFMDKAVGNFHSSQRPVFFQGTLGVALGLFQTYMLTLGQSVYRQLEMKNYKALGKASLTQSTIFGAESMPGFKEVSQMIGEHFSDENVDLTTGTYRALGDTAANFVLYGLPSNLGPSLYTRGDVSIRPPNVLAGAQNTVAVSFASQMLDTFGQVGKAMEQQGAGDKARAIAQALSMQSMSRPLARGSELMTGYSVTRKGNTVQTPEEVWTATGIISRVLGTRPLEESKLREAMHLNTFYGSVDREARQKLVGELKTAIRSGEVSDELLTKVSSTYLRKGGTPSGWRAAYNQAIGQTNLGGDEALIDKMKPNNPLNFMIHNLD